MKSFETFSTLTKYWSKIFTQNQSLGGFITVNIIDVKSFFFVLAISFILIGLVNFLPMPGFVIGNTIIAIIEIIRKKTFNDRKLKIIKISSLSVSLIIIALCVF
jgi:membrane-associated protease RseP (regulator of RpoE activity)